VAAESMQGELHIGQTARPAAVFTAIPSGRGSSLIVEQILALLREGALRPGDRLPPERELCQLLRASRATVREALRVLEARGFLDRRVGARGGAFVTSPTSGRAAEGLADMLATNGLTAIEVTEARVVLELGVLPLVCERATAADVDDLRRLVKRDLEAHENGTYDLDYSVEFHLRLISCAHNEAIDMLGRSMRDALGASLIATQRSGFDRGPGLHEHEQLVSAVECGDVGRAIGILRDHLSRNASRAPEVDC
jgi:GntR family transcriptional repressor for pyruvate dehydrogenase complex